MDDLASASAEGNSIKLRHYCRNPRCRSKLKQPVENPRRAFCTRGCHSSFYHSRCLRTAIRAKDFTAGNLQEK